jgi:CobQ-like glutamine amidotransferase family enzyme
MGGAQDRQQKLVSDNLHKKSKTIKKLVDSGVPGLFICGAYQFLGNYYRAFDGTTIPGLEIFDLHTIHPGDQTKRIIGNIVTKWGNKTLVGFENHGGRTYLGKTTEPFAIVTKGDGNNGEDGTEGVFYKNSIGTYLHGPLLPKNPDLADWILATALRVKYQKEIRLSPITNILEEEARAVILDRLHIQE